VIRDLGSRNGTFVNGELLSGERPLSEGAVIFIGAHVFVYRRMSRSDLAAIAADRRSPLGPVPTNSPAVARLNARLRKLARSPVDLLLGGETGVGKQIFAEAIHKESGRRGPFVAINCAAGDPSLRDRLEDIGVLVCHFLRELPQAFSIRAFRALFLWNWPGNVRQLGKTVQMAGILGDGHGMIDEDLPMELEQAVIEGAGNGLRASFGRPTSGAWHLASAASRKRGRSGARARTTANPGLALASEGWPRPGDLSGR